LPQSALALCYSAAEYCAPVWSCSAHASRVDVQLNSTMCLISDTLHSTPLPWLPVFSNIEPPALQRKAATDKLVEKIVKHNSWPIQPDILSPPLLRLTSRKPPWLDLQPVDIKGRWRHTAPAGGQGASPVGNSGPPNQDPSSYTARNDGDDRTMVLYTLPSVEPIIRVNDSAIIIVAHILIYSPFPNLVTKSMLDS